ncbi:hypothetical protein FH972_004707 [Carpinus fangiana]|uniref:Uncharacterized protein n=1 Tax=Carpinus fangiana TaxID=176857 RepID=A0A5N6QM00_9ROSI|nr:hypothetical protein FH972_004707 [Carpinus fangiana]
MSFPWAPSACRPIQNVDATSKTLKPTHLQILHKSLSLLDQLTFPRFFLFFNPIFLSPFLVNKAIITRRSKSNEQSKLMHYIYMLSPIRIISKATEFYVKSMVDCAGRVEHGVVVGNPIARVRRLPNDDEVLRQLPRKVSKRKVDNKASFDMHRQQEVRKPIWMLVQWGEL